MPESIPTGFWFRDHFPEQRLKKCKSIPCFDGVIGRIKYEAHDEIKRLNIPVVNTWAANSIKDMTSVLVDYKQVGEMAADHLVRKGFRNFVLIDFRSSGTKQDFFQGFAGKVKPLACPCEKIPHQSQSRCSGLFVEQAQ